ncbi:MAG: 4Fe-4S binding protein, partial [Bacteroidales bacterium]|nr:4Fe-4S binding protein [Bacteroidales bacterium]
MLRRIRVVLATLFFILITLLFLDFTGFAPKHLVWMAKIQFLPAVLSLNIIIVVALILFTIVFGRIYCSIICPLGVLQDIFGWFGKKAKKNRYTYSKAQSWLRYTVLGIFILAIIFGVASLVALLAPYSSFGRIAQNLLSPIYIWGNNVLASFADKTFISREVWIRSLPTFIIAAATFVILLILAWRNGRTYCNTICPVGTVLSFFARFSIFRPVIDKSKCVGCNLCVKNCKASCINIKGHKIDYSRCVVCGDCISKCKKDAIS